MKRFYDYIIYKLFSWRIRKKDDTPIATVIFLLTITHSFQLLILYSVTREVWNYPNYLPDNKVYILIFFFGFAGLHYFLFYNKERWERYIEDFKDESEVERKRGWIIVTAYLLGSVLLFFIIMPVLFGF